MSKAHFMSKQELKSLFQYSITGAIFTNSFPFYNKINLNFRIIFNFPMPERCSFLTRISGEKRLNDHINT